jgi:hypothetical protein
MDTQWKEFETAVAAFAKGLDSKAIVQHNVRLPDKATGKLRQRDVWIEAKIGGFFPVKVLVSCKRESRKLDSGDIDHFHGELQNSTAHKGVIFSYSGFTDPAVETAKAFDIDCCRLYVDQPPDIPEVLLLKAFCCRPSILFALLSTPDVEWRLKTYGDLFRLTTDDEGTTVLDMIARDYDYIEKEAVATMSATSFFPSDLQSRSTLSKEDDSSLVIEYLLTLKWRIFSAPISAHLLNGAYLINTNDFRGTQSLPWVDMQGPHPGEHWIELPERPTLKSGYGVYVCTGPDLKGNIVAQLSSKSIA